MHSNVTIKNVSWRQFRWATYCSYHLEWQYNKCKSAPVNFCTYSHHTDVIESTVEVRN